LWSEIREIRPVLLVYDKASHSRPPSEFGNVGEDTKESGIYEVYKKDGSRVIVSRKYTDH
jgi:hypothetical protein